MTRRERIIQGLSGGTPAPAPRLPHRRIMEGFGQQPRPAPAGLGRSLEQARNRPTGIPAGRLGRNGPGVGEAMQPGLGAQLSRRVQSGAIDEAQAQQTARQRQLLKNAFGSDWRTQVFGKGGARGIGGPFAPRLVAAKRAEALERAKRKLY